MLYPGPSLYEIARKLSLKAVAWVAGGIAWVDGEHMTLLHKIPVKARLSSDPLYTGFLCPAHKNTIVHLTDSVGTRHTMDLMFTTLANFKA